MAKKHAKPTSKPHPTSKNKNKNKDASTEATNSKRVDQRHTTDAPIFFFKDDEEPYGFLCQWYRCRFTDPTSGLEFTSAEQWMMWNKAQLAGDEASAKTIMSTTSPRKQKQLGRDVEGFDADAWDEIKLNVVERGNYLKFTQGTNVASMKMEDEGDPVSLESLLLATKERELAEVSRFDRVWGIGFDAQQALEIPREKWGQNLLGTALMNVREKIRKETEKEEGQVNT
ncbi:DUF1768-domain-containing protein [Aureobasidium sp. EXF-8845]|nr:DUF1768-domain-containing protein [Aureobasidium sp. EXF-8845]KAI4845571.1 DUF1768-domain-containing protein [Aureobasidium sp. EXF-8846]